MAQLPSGGSVANGQAAISAGPGILNINQSSQQAIINWQSFSIGAGQTTRFVMPNGGSVLNRVTGSDASAIMGNLQANGNVFLINPHGVLIGNGARINVGSLTASTLNLSDQNFLNGDTLRFGGSSSASVQNFGEITSLGDVFLIGRNVSNAGRIKGSHVGLAAGGSVELRQLDPDNPGLERLSVHASGNEAPSQVGAENKPEGIIEATTAELKAAGGNIYALAVNNGGVVRANSVVKEKGRIYLKAEGGTVLNSGTLDVAGKDAGAHGGDVQVLGKNVGLVGNSVIDASGDSGGGEVLIGGDYQGKNSSVLNAENTVMTSGSSINASASGQGNGGRVILWSDYTTKFLGEIEARGAGSGGDGGFVETSGKDTLIALGFANVGSTSGRGGMWLLDPRNITISSAATSSGTYSDDGGAQETTVHEWDDVYGVNINYFSRPFDGFTPTGDDSVINVATINAALNAGGSVEIKTYQGGSPNTSAGSQAGNITIDAAIAKTGHVGSATTSSMLTFRAENNIIINDSITASSTEPLFVVLEAANNIEINAPITGVEALTMSRFKLNGTYDAETGDFGIVERELCLRQLNINAEIDVNYFQTPTLKTYVNTPLVTGTKEFAFMGDVYLQQDLELRSQWAMIGEGNIFGGGYNAVIDNLTSTGVTLMGSPDYPGFSITGVNNFTQKNGKYIGLGYGNININGAYTLNANLLVPFHVNITAASKSGVTQLPVTKQLAMDLGADEELATSIAAADQTVSINISGASDRSAPSSGGSEGEAGDSAPASGEGEGGTPSEETPNN